MCNPYAYAAMQFGNSYMQYKNDKAQANSVNANTFDTAKRINNEAIYTDISLQKKKSVEYDKAAADKFKLSLEAKKKTGSAKVQLFERGIQGNSFDYLINDIKRNEGRAFGVTDTNYENVIISIEDSRLAYNRQFTNQILNLPLAASPRFGSYALGAAANASMMFMNTQAPTTPSSSNSINFNPDGST